MVQGTRIKNLILSILIMMIFPVMSFSQIHDPNKYDQLRSMETAEDWYFTPQFYYYMMHKKYSGASSNNNIFNFKIKFKEEKSNVKRTMVPRAAQVPIEVATVNKINAEIDSIYPLAIEESIRFVERNVDINYWMYNQEFQELGTAISNSILYSLEKSGGQLKEVCDELQQQYDAICSEIEYIHQTGPTHEIESTKRQLAYEESKKKLNELAHTCCDVAYYALTIYNLNNHE